MRILGIDPGSGRMGWGVVDQEEPDGVVYIAHGCVVTEQESTAPVRLFTLHRDLQVVIKTYKPETIIVEQLFFGINARTAMAVSQARGVIMLACAQAKLPFFEYTSIAVKHLVGGSGKTEKKEMQRVVRELLSKNKRTLSFSAKDKAFDDAADALAIAIHHAWKMSGKDKEVLALQDIERKKIKVEQGKVKKMIRLKVREKKLNFKKKKKRGLKK